jgi:hypothetical protein
MGDAEGPIKSENAAAPSADTGNNAGDNKTPGIADRVSQTFAGLFNSLTTSSGAARIILWAVGAVVGAVVLLWLVDKALLYFIAQSYVDALANALDLNPYLTNALVLLTFLAAFFFASKVRSFSKRKRLTGIVGLSGLLVLHSLAMWLATRNQTIDREGHALQCYVLSRNGTVTYGQHPGVDPATGRECRPVKPELIERLKAYQAGKRPQRVTDLNPVFFDPRSGEPIVWYYQAKDGSIEIFDLMGFEPDTGEELLPVTKEIADAWRIQETRRPPKLIADPDKYVFFDPLNGQPRAWFWTSSGDRYEFYDAPGYQPQTGDKLEIVTRDVLNRWRDQQKAPTTAQRVPNKVTIAADTVFFDPVNGNPRLWFWRKDKGEYEFFDGPGFDPQNGQQLQSFTRVALTQYQQEIDDKAKQLQAEQERIEAEQKAKQDAEARQQAALQQKAADEERQRAAQSERASTLAKQCDDLAANPNDANRVGSGVYYADLKPVADQAVDACDAAVKQNPDTLRFQYQLARALELSGDSAAHVKNRQRAFELEQSLVRAGYAAAFDNLASIYRDHGDINTAVVLFRKGVDLGDSDSMVSLGDLIGDGRVAPMGPQENQIELYKRAAELGNQNGARGYQAELAKAQQAQQQQIQQIQQQRVMLQIMGTVLRNIH